MLNIFVEMLTPLRRLRKVFELLKPCFSISLVIYGYICKAKK